MLLWIGRVQFFHAEAKNSKEGTEKQEAGCKYREEQLLWQTLSSLGSSQKMSDEKIKHFTLPFGSD